MSSTRRRALDAAVTLIGTEGMRALTHGRVDAAAGLAPGSTSNHFRTRAALLRGVITWIAEEERGDVHVPEIHSEADFVTAMIHMGELQSGPLAVRTRARYALFLDADPDAAAPLLAQRALFEDWTRSMLRSLGGEQAAERTLFLMAALDGILLHRITIDPHAPIAEPVRLTVAAALHG